MYALRVLVVAPMLVALQFSPLAGQALNAAPNRISVRAEYVGWEVCQGCHLAVVTEWKTTKMGKVLLGAPRTALEARGCEACHGPASEHIKANKNTQIFRFTRTSTSTAPEKDAMCLQCHEKAARVFWKNSMHESRGVACVDCHTIMHSESDGANLKKQSVIEVCGRCHEQRKSQALRFAHMPVGEGKMECTSCHNPHGSANDKLLVATSVNEVCFTCHSEKRGPYLWQHAPVVENCANCHDAHGTNHEKLLKVPKPRLCQQCHDPTFHPTQPRDASLAVDARFLRNRQCTNCHFSIHGSNHPGGREFTR